MTNTLASAPHRAARPETVGPASRRHLATLRSIIATWREGTWRERIRFRWQLRQMSKDNPHLIDDIGLTRRQVEAEIIKRFWQA
ncbi:DUF1127 domain-containing protein [Mesorhizobium sp. AR10]|uniref:DUF1127 domain-containing protein n=1 Tax=Mesorhizobium sp. AR10 TaxID=2865839 RepID=UPI00215E03A5|nr:DUF1127 domain-containing protein [Mesorhizobium sp. AR10]UVK37101.1 DUF1127 domain-containing protein [Mesorhizobium sp. AR10]